MATQPRTRRSAAAQAAAQATVVDNDSQHVEDAHDDFQAAFAAFQHAMDPRIDASKRTVVAIVASCATYALGAVSGVYVAAWLSSLVLSVSGLMFLAVVVEVMVMLMALIASMLAGAYVARWVSTGQAIDDLAAAKQWVKRKFSSTSSFVKSSMVH